MSKHSPGPWRYVDSWDQVISVDGRCICAVDYDDGGVAHANGTLIATAPELLARLMDYEGVMDESDTCDTPCLTCDLIRKANGW